MMPCYEFSAPWLAMTPRKTSFANPAQGLQKETLQKSALKFNTLKHKVIVALS